MEVSNYYHFNQVGTNNKHNPQDKRWKYLADINTIAVFFVMNLLGIGK